MFRNLMTALIMGVAVLSTTAEAAPGADRRSHVVHVSTRAVVGPMMPAPFIEIRTRRPYPHWVWVPGTWHQIQGVWHWRAGCWRPRQVRPTMHRVVMRRIHRPHHLVRPRPRRARPPIRR